MLRKSRGPSWSFDELVALGDEWIKINKENDKPEPINKMAIKILKIEKEKNENYPRTLKSIEEKMSKIARFFSEDEYYKLSRKEKNEILSLAKGQRITEVPPILFNKFKEATNKGEQPDENDSFTSVLNFPSKSNKENGKESTEEGEKADTSEMPLKSPSAIPRDIPPGVPQGIPYGVPQGMPQGISHGMPYGIPPGVPFIDARYEAYEKDQKERSDFHYRLSAYEQVLERQTKLFISDFEECANRIIKKFKENEESDD